MTPEKVKVLIIGSGPAGYTAAIYAARAGLNPVLYTGGQPGGQLTITGDVENFPGYPQGIDGTQMMMDLQAQAERFETKVINGLITKVDFSGYPLKAWADDALEIEAEAVIIATGASAKYLGLPSEQRLSSKGVSACAVCDGFFFRGMDVAVVGAGDDVTFLFPWAPNRDMYRFYLDQLRGQDSRSKMVAISSPQEVPQVCETLKNVRHVAVVAHVSSRDRIDGVYAACGKNWPYREVKNFHMTFSEHWLTK